MGNCAHKQNSGEDDESSLSSIEVKPSKQHYYHSKNHEDSSSLSSIEEGSMQSRIQERFVSRFFFLLTCPIAVGQTPFQRTSNELKHNF